MSKKKKSSLKILPDSCDLNFCPMCQIPLHFLRITGEMHLLRCEKNSWDQAPECKVGINCFSSDFHHYWDYTHATLAKHRSLNLNTSRESEEPTEEMRHSPPKKVKESPRKKTKPNSKKQTTRSKRKHKVLSDCDSSSDDDFKLRSPRKSGIKNSSKCFSPSNIKNGSKSKRPKVKEERNKRRVLSDSDKESSSDSGVLFLNTQDSSSKPGSSQQHNKKEEQNTPEKGVSTHFMFPNSPDMFTNCESSNLEPKVKILEEDTIPDLKYFSLGLAQIPLAENEMVKQEPTPPTELRSKEFNQEEMNISPMKFSSQEYDQYPTPTKFLTQEFKEIADTSPEDYFKFQLKEESESPALDNIDIAQAPQIQFSDSSDEDCEVNSETGEILYTAKFENDENSQGSDGKPQKQVQDEPILVMENNKKVNKQVQSIEAWKKILNNRKQSTDKSKSTNMKSTTSYTTEPTEHRLYASTDRAPFYKLIPDTDFVVDGFRNGPVLHKNNYFLSHFHYDHYIGLNKHFSKTIHCSRITSELLKSVIKIDDKYIRIIDVGDTKVINQVEVTALDANHCPGALMFVFKTLHGQSYLHTGDFRADISMQNIDILKNTYFEKVYLDTTYCNPQYNFPSQSAVLDKLLKLIQENHERYPNTLYICGSYTIGKEKVYISILKKMKWKIYVESYKRKILKILNNETINTYIVDNVFQAKLHVISMSKLNNIHHLMTYYESYKSRYDKVVAIKPTGWTYSERNDNNINVKKISDDICVYEISYSEHSSFLELCTFVKFLKYKQIVCTVNVKNSEKQIQLIDSFIKKKLNNTNQVTNTLNSYFKRGR